MNQYDKTKKNKLNVLVYKQVKINNLRFKTTTTGGVRGDVRPRPPREQDASNSLRPHLLLNAAHPRERGQVTVNLCLFSVPDQQRWFLLLLLLFPFLFRRS